MRAMKDGLILSQLVLLINPGAKNTKPLAISSKGA